MPADGPPAGPGRGPPRIAIVGAGAVGAWVGGCMALAGHDVTLIDPWPAHVAAMNRDGLRLTDADGERRARVLALDICNVQSLNRRPVDIAFICMKLPDTAWATELIRPCLADRGFVVTMQNGLVEETVAGIVGWSRTLGAIASTISVELVAPGHVERTQRAGGDAYTVFRVGELHGGITARAEAVAAMLRSCDSARVTGNLHGERWAKLVANTMSTAVCGISGLSLSEIVEHPGARALQIRLAGEAIRVGRALGYHLEPVRGLAADTWAAAAEGDARALEQCEAALRAGNARRTGAGGRSGTAQDLAKGRWPEVEHMNGCVARLGREAGLPATTHERVTALVIDAARGDLVPGIDALDRLVLELGVLPASR